MTGSNTTSELHRVLEQIAPQTKCIIIYGSCAGNASSSSPESDVDFIVVYKDSVNPYTYSVFLGKELANRKVYYDYCWYGERYLLSLIRQGIDLFLFYSIFSQGEVLYSENGFVTQVLDSISQFSPLDTFQSTCSHRNANINNSIRVWARNLSRILFDHISTLYVRSQATADWQNLRIGDELVRKSNDTGLIDTETYRAYFQLRSICKLKIDQIGHQRSSICQQLIRLDLFVTTATNRLNLDS